MKEPLKFGYQIINFWIHNIFDDRFYTAANAILENKEMATYIELFLNLNKYIYDNRENKRNLNLLILFLYIAILKLD